MRCSSRELDPSFSARRIDALGKRRDESSSTRVKRRRVDALRVTHERLQRELEALERTRGAWRSGADRRGDAVKSATEPATLARGEPGSVASTR
jgi:hypothetical protein